MSDWVKKYSEYRNNVFPGKGNLRPGDKEIKDMIKKIKNLGEENAILKKAMRIFSQDVK